MEAMDVDLHRAVLSRATLKTIECLMQRHLAISIKHSTPEPVRQIVVQGGEIGRTVARLYLLCRLAGESLDLRTEVFGFTLSVLLVYS